MKTIGRYRLLESLGTCEMGTLSRAYDQSLDRVVALRLIPDEMGLSAGLKARFFHEARAWARLRHPNVAAVYDLGEADGPRVEVVPYASLAGRTDLDAQRVTPEQYAARIEARQVGVARRMIS